MILLTQKIGDGPTKHCDKRCFDAKKGNCKCCCGGRNHGVGEAQAMQNLREIFLDPNYKNGAVVTRSAQRALRRTALEEWGEKW